MSAKIPAGTSSARHVLEMLVSFSEGQPEWTVPELATRLAISRAMAYRHLALLREFGLVEASAVGRYRLSSRTIALADAASAGRTSLEEVARPLMQQIRDSTGETVFLARRVGSSVYCIERLDSPQPIRLQLDRGRPLPLHSGSLARVLLAALPPSERAAYFAESDLPARPDHLQDEALDAVVEQGYAESMGEIDGSVWGFSAPVRQDGQIIAALGVTAPFDRNDSGQLDAIRKGVMLGSEELTSRLMKRGVTARTEHPR